MKVDADTRDMAADAMDDSDIGDMTTVGMHDTDIGAMSAEDGDLSASKTKGFEGTDCADAVSDEDEWVYVDFGEDSVAGDGAEEIDPKEMTEATGAEKPTEINTAEGLKSA